MRIVFSPFGLLVHSTGRSCAMALLFAAMLSFSPNSARALETVDWTDPTGRFTLAFSSLGWAIAPSRPEQALTIIRRDTLTDNRLRMCTVTFRPYDRGSGATSQQQANERLGVAAVRLTERAMTASNEMIGGVSVIRMSAENQGFGVITSDFLLPEQDGFSFVSVSCAAPVPLTSEERENMTAVVNSLTFKSR